MSDGTGSVARIRSRRGAMGLGLVLVFAGCTGSGDPSGTPVASDEAQAPVVQPTPASDPFPTPPGSVRVGLIGLPPRGVEPSRPETGELLMRFGSGTTFGCGGWCSWPVYADGRFVWKDDYGVPETVDGIVPAYLERRLTPEGVELLRAEILSSPRMRQRQGRWWAAYRWFSAEAFDADRASSVTWKGGSGPPFGDSVQVFGEAGLAEFYTRISARSRGCPRPHGMTLGSEPSSRRATSCTETSIRGRCRLPPTRCCDPVDASSSRWRRPASWWLRSKTASSRPARGPPDPTSLEYRYERNRGVGYLSLDPALPQQTSC